MTEVARTDVSRSWARPLVLLAVVGAVALVALLGAFALSGGDGDGGLEPVPRSERPAEDFRNLADWLRERAEG